MLNTSSKKMLFRPAGPKHANCEVISQTMESLRVSSKNCPTLTLWSFSGWTNAMDDVVGIHLPQPAQNQHPLRRPTQPQFRWTGESVSEPFWAGRGVKTSPRCFQIIQGPGSRIKMVPCRHLFSEFLVSPFSHGKRTGTALDVPEVECKTKGRQRIGFRGQK